MRIKYSELEMHDKAVIVERVAKRLGTRQMYVDQWMRENDPLVFQEVLQLTEEDRGG